jgi:hypothetical protein
MPYLSERVVVASASSRAVVTLACRFVHDAYETFEERMKVAAGSLSDFAVTIAAHG